MNANQVRSNHLFLKSYFHQPNISAFLSLITSDFCVQFLYTAMVKKKKKILFHPSYTVMFWSSAFMSHLGIDTVSQMYTSSTPRHMGKSFKSVINTVYSEVTSIWEQLCCQRCTECLPWSVRVTAAQQLDVYSTPFSSAFSPVCAACPGFICAKVWFGPL